MATFKEQVEEIIHDTLTDSCSYKTCILLETIGGDMHKMCSNCMANRILAAHNAELDRIAEGCNKFKEKNANNVPYIKHDANSRIGKCQSYILGERGQ